MHRPVKRLYALLVLSTLVAASLASAPTAHACSCATQSVPDALRAASAVFEARVVALQTLPADGESPPSVLATLHVTRTWKGANRETVLVRTRADEASCGFTFEQDQTYLVYADGELDEHGAGLTTTLCSRSKRIEQASEDLAVLGAGVTPVDIVDDPVVQRERLPPSSGGCGGCAVASRDVPTAAFAALGAVALGLALAVRRRR